MTIEDKNIIIRKRGLNEGRPLQFDSKKILCSVRIPESLKVKLVHDYGSIQSWVDIKIKDELMEIERESV